MNVEPESWDKIRVRPSSCLRIFVAWNSGEPSLEQLPHAKTRNPTDAFADTQPSLAALQEQLFTD